MKTPGLLVAAIVLAALTGTLYWSNHHKSAEKSADSTLESSPRILTLQPADVSGMSIRKKGGDSVVLARNDAGQWQITAPAKLPADRDTVSSVLSTLASLNSERLVEDKAINLEQYGLAQPSIAVEIVKKDKKVQQLLIGDDTPTGNGVYAAVAGDARVFTMASYHKNAVDKSANDLRDKRLLPFDSDKVSGIELTAKKQTIAFGRSKDEWQIVRPKPFRADRSQVEELLRTLRDAKMDLSGSEDDKKSVAAFGAGAPFASVKVTDISGTQELQVRKNKDEYYAKSSAVAGIHKISSGTGAGLDKSLDDFRNKKLFDLGFAEPDKIELHDGPKGYFLTRSSGDWWSNGTKMDPGTVSALVDKIRDLSASSFLEAGFTASMLDLTVTSDGGKRVEKVMVSKNGEKYLAKRENEPALYELNASGVSELQKSAADVKPAPVSAPPPPKKK
jgi:Domain of unknown function (DUF4340)